MGSIVVALREKFLENESKPQAMQAQGFFVELNRSSWPSPGTRDGGTGRPLPQPRGEGISEGSELLRLLGWAGLVVSRLGVAKKHLRGCLVAQARGLRLISHLRALSS